MNKTPLLVSIFFYLLYRFLVFLTGEVWLSILVFIIPITFLIFNLVVRNKLAYKNWFLKTTAFLREQKVYEVTSEIANELLFEKLLEVITDSEFNLLDSNKAKMQILCGTAVNFWTWGENIYIQLSEDQAGNSKIQFVSTTLFGNTSWNRNTHNYTTFIASFEASLTI